jgi:hypothetical protein
MIAKLPVHDAGFCSLTAHSSDAGDVTIRVTIEIDPDESMLPFLEMGVQQRRMSLRFENCHRTALTLLGFTCDREQVSDWEALPVSGVSDECQPDSTDSHRRFLHHRLQFSAGSRLEIVAEGCYMEGQA